MFFTKSFLNAELDSIKLEGITFIKGTVVLVVGEVIFKFTTIKREHHLEEISLAILAWLGYHKGVVIHFAENRLNGLVVLKCYRLSGYPVLAEVTVVKLLELGKQRFFHCFTCFRVSIWVDINHCKP